MKPKKTVIIIRGVISLLLLIVAIAIAHTNKPRCRIIHTHHHLQCRRRVFGARYIPGRAFGGDKTTSGTTTASTTTTGSSTTSSPSISHIVWILMENKSYSQIIGSSSAPYINSLASNYGLATNYTAIGHPSAPNYIALTDGSNGSCCTDDGYHPQNVTSIFGQLPTGQSRSLEENMPSNCDTGNGGEYAVRHNPMAYYTPIISDCNSYDVPLNNGAPDLSAQFTFITPNLINDMHDGTVQDGDNWLKQEIPVLMATPQYQSNSTAIFLVWDENDGSTGNQVPLIVISPYTNHVIDNVSLNHFSLLRKTEELFNLPLLGAANTAADMGSVFGF